MDLKQGHGLFAASFAWRQPLVDFQEGAFEYYSDSYQEVYIANRDIKAPSTKYIPKNPSNPWTKDRHTN